MIITNENIKEIDYESLTPEQKWQVDWHIKEQISKEIEDEWEKSK